MVTDREELNLPPVSEIAIVTMVLVVIGGVFIAGHIPNHVPLLLPTILMVAGYAVLIANLYLLSRVREFAWGMFRLVFTRAFAGYGVIAGLLTYVFVRDEIPNDVMAFLFGMLLLFALDIPLLLAFSVARYQPPESSSH
jgi:hypothetical protein